MTKEEVKKALETISPILKAHGGDLELIEFDSKTKTVKIKLTGGCAACPMAEITLKSVIEKMLKEKLPEIKKVVSE